ncbi:MAG: hypothetical protein WC229_03105 [Candidatus Paceibacterota bacterium]|jgi:hypothetical protein
MFDIAKYLEKFTVLANSRHFLRDSVQGAIKEICGIEIDPKKIEVKDFVARINERPIIKSEIFLKKNRILSSLKDKTGGKVIDII